MPLALKGRAIEMKLYNSLTRKKEEFVPLDGKNIKMYACGPTVYNYFHVGNARCFVIFDLLRRYFEYRGYNVTFVQNFTDIDDKMIKRANEEKTTVKEVAEKYIKEYFTDAEGLGVRKATFHPRATENIDEIVNMIQTLIDGGYAYKAYPDGDTQNCDVYFSTKSFRGYGKLSHMPMDEIENGASKRVNLTEIKKDPVDFALWKAVKPGEPYWETPFGKGRPGWHIECSAMSRKFLGPNIDIHCGGQDLIFPHHENEIAQSEAYDKCIGCEDTTFSRFWLHNGYINIDGKKMSKSEKFFTVRDVAKEYGYDAIRFFIISAYYKSPVNYSREALVQAQASLKRLHECQENIDFRLKNASGNMSDEEEKLYNSFLERRSQMIDALDDDFNTADGISAVFELTKDINIALQKEVSKELLEKTKELYLEMLTLFGIEKKTSAGENDAEIEKLVEQRTAAKKAKDYASADAIRDKLKEMGILVEDTPMGAKWKRI